MINSLGMLLLISLAQLYWGDPPKRGRRVPSLHMSVWPQRLGGHTHDSAEKKLEGQTLGAREGHNLPSTSAGREGSAGIMRVVFKNTAF